MSTHGRGPGNAWAGIGARYGSTRRVLVRLPAGLGSSLRIGPDRPLARLTTDEQPVGWQLQSVRWQDAAGNWQESSGWRLEACTAEACVLTTKAGKAPASRLEFHVGQPPGWVTVAAWVPQATWIAMDLAALPTEHYLGLGERFDRIDQRGQQIDLHVTNGASGGLAYKPIPLGQC